MSDTEKPGFMVPMGIPRQEVQIFADAFNEAVSGPGGSSEGRVELIEISSRGVIEGQVGAELLMVVSGGVSVWFTKKWADDYLWPIIKQKIDRPSKMLIEWLKAIFK